MGALSDDLTVGVDAHRAHADVVTATVGPDVGLIGAAALARAAACNQGRR
jgi:hypothetical protein